MRKFHLTDLPKERLYLVLEPGFRKEFFDRIWIHAGKSTTIARKLKVDNETIRRWKLGYREIPNGALLKLNGLLKDKRFPVEKLEKNVKAYKGESSKRLTLNPKLPIVEDERLVRIVSHLLCDGYDGGKTHCPAYINTEPRLIQKFIEDLKVFGEVPIRIREDKNNSKAKRIKYSVEFPRIYTHIIRRLYGIEDFSVHKSSLPRRFFKLSKRLLFPVIQAFIDDEGSVQESRLMIGLSNRNLIAEFREFIIIKFPGHSNSIGEIKEANTKGSYAKSKHFTMEIKRPFAEFLYKNEGLNHPRKQILLGLMVKRRRKAGNVFAEGVAKKLILDILSKTPSSTWDLALALNMGPKSIRFHLENLKKEDKIELAHNAYRSVRFWKVSK